MEAFDLYMIFLFSIIVIAYISHSPLFKLKSSKLEEIAQKGLIHYTTKENAERIINDGFLKGEIWYGLINTKISFLYLKELNIYQHVTKLKRTKKILKFV